MLCMRIGHVVMMGGRRCVMVRGMVVHEVRTRLDSDRSRRGGLAQGLRVHMSCVVRICIVIIRLQKIVFLDFS